MVKTYEAVWSHGQRCGMQGRDLEELVADSGGQASRQRGVAAAEVAFRAACTFRPDTSASRAVERGVSGAMVPFAAAANADRLAQRSAARKQALLVRPRPPQLATYGTAAAKSTAFSGSTLYMCTGSGAPYAVRPTADGRPMLHILFILQRQLGWWWMPEGRKVAAGQAARSEQQQAEARECTFAPRVEPLALAPLDTPPAVVPGLNGFLERKVHPPPPLRPPAHPSPLLLVAEGCLQPGPCSTSAACTWSGAQPAHGWRHVCTLRCVSPCKACEAALVLGEAAVRNRAGRGSSYGGGEGGTGGQGVRAPASDACAAPHRATPLFSHLPRGPGVR